MATIGYKIKLERFYYWNNPYCMDIGECNKAFGDQNCIDMEISLVMFLQVFSILGMR